MKQRSMQHQFVQADRIPGIDARLERVVPWIRTSDQHYFSLLLADHDIDATLARWVRNPYSELALQTTRLLITNDRIAGGFVGSSGRQIGRRREADFIDLARRSDELRCPALRSRIQDANSLLAPVDPNDFYLSKIGVVAEMKREELQPMIIDECLERARCLGLDRVRIDVDKSDHLTCTICTDRGFEIFRRGYAAGGEICYLNMVRPL